MVKLIKICDVCGKDMSEKSTTIFHRYRIKRFLAGRWEEVDVCYECIEKIMIIRAKEQKNE